MSFYTYTLEDGTEKTIDLRTIDWANAEPVLPLEEFDYGGDLEIDGLGNEHTAESQQGPTEQGAGASRESPPLFEPSNGDVGDVDFFQYEEMDDTTLGAMMAGDSGRDAPFEQEPTQDALPVAEDQREIDKTWDSMPSAAVAHNSDNTTLQQSQTIETPKQSGTGTRGDPIELSDDEEEAEILSFGVRSPTKEDDGSHAQHPQSDARYQQGPPTGDHPEAEEVAQIQSEQISEDDPRIDTFDSAGPEGNDQDQAQQPSEISIEDGADVEADADVEDEFGITGAMQSHSWGDKFPDLSEAAEYLDTGLGVVKWTNIKDDDWKKVQDEASSWTKRICEAMFARPDPPKWKGKNEAKSANYVAGQKTGMSTLRICQQSVRNRKILEARVACLVETVVSMHEKGGIPKLHMVLVEDHKRGVKPETTYTCSGRLGAILDAIRRNKLVAADVSEGLFESLIYAPKAYIQRKLNNVSSNSTKKDVMDAGRRVLQDGQKTQSAEDAREARMSVLDETPLDPGTNLAQTPRQASSALESPNSGPRPGDQLKAKQQLGSTVGRGSLAASRDNPSPATGGNEDIAVPGSAKVQTGRIRRRRLALDTRVGSTTIDPQDEVLQAHISSVKRATKNSMGGKLSSNFNLPEEDTVGGQQLAPYKGPKRSALGEETDAAMFRTKKLKMVTLDRDQMHDAMTPRQELQSAPYSSLGSAARTLGGLPELQDPANFPYMTNGRPLLDDTSQLAGQLDPAPLQVESRSYEPATEHTSFDPRVPRSDTYDPDQRAPISWYGGSQRASDTSDPTFEQHLPRSTDGASYGEFNGRLGAAHEWQHHSR